MAWFHARPQAFRSDRIWLLLALALLSFAQIPHSTGPAAQQFKNWLAAYDDNNWNVYRDFLSTHFASGAVNVFQDQSLRNQTGSFDLIKIEDETATTLAALVYGRESDKLGAL
jgi:hypothetical protein